MPTQTKIWTTWNGTKIPLELMETKHIKSAYTRCSEVVIATDLLAIEEKIDYNIGKLSLLKIKESPMSYEECKKWISIFEAEMTVRKLKIPIVTKNTMVDNWNKRQDRKRYMKDNFSKTLNYDYGRPTY